MADEAKDLVIKALKEAEDSLDNRRDKWLTYYRNYRLKYEDEVEAQAFNKIFIPMTFEVVNTYKPLITLKRPVIAVLPRAQDDEEAAKAVTKWFQYQYQCQDMKRKVKDIAHYFLLYGEAVTYHYYDIRPKTVTYRDLRSEDMRESSETIICYDDPQSEVVNLLEDWYPDPHGFDMDTCLYATIRRLVPHTALPHLLEHHYIDRIPDKLNDLYNEASEDRMQRIYDITEDSPVYDLAKKGLVEFMEYFSHDRRIILANREEVLRDSKNELGELPFTLFKNEDLAHELHAIGEAELVEYYQAEGNTLRRISLDNVKDAMKRKYIAREGCGLDPAVLNDENQYVAWVTGNPADVLMERTPVNLEQVGLVTIDQNRRDAQNATGAYDAMKGAGTEDLKSQTATAASIAQTGMFNRVFYKLSNFEDGIEGWMKKTFELARRHYPANRTYRLGIGQEFRFETIGYDDFQREFDFYVESSSTKPLTQQEKIIMGDVIIGRGMNNEYFDQREMWAWYLENMDFPRPSRILLSPEKLQAAQQAQAQAVADQREQATEDLAVQKVMDNTLTVKPGADNMPMVQL